MKHLSVSARTVGVLHLGLALLHAAAHWKLGILGSALHTAFVVLVIYIAPIAALAFMGRAPQEAARWLWLALFGSFLFGGYHHFVLVSPDHVDHLPAHAWSPAFRTSAVLLAACDGLGALLLAVQLARSSRLTPGARNVLLVDGSCVFCNRLVSLVLRFDRSGVFHFAHIQSAFARAILLRQGRDPSDVDPIYLIANEGTAEEALLIDGEAGREVWPRLFFAGALIRLLPLPLLNPSYTLFARIRYSLFGKLDQCYVPSVEERVRYLE